jgi:hypothetical protein
VKGANFSSGCTFTWLDAEGKSLQDASATGEAEYITDTTMKVSRPSSVIRGFILELMSKAHLKARKKL